MFGPTIRGQLTIEARESQWRARIAGFNVPVEHDQQGIMFRLPGDAGEFRGHMSADSIRILGQWIQTTRDQRYATPIELSELSQGIWRGFLTLLDDRLSLYVWIRREADGSTTAFIRNPDFNYLGRHSYRITLTDQTVAFSDDRNRSSHLDGTYDEKTDLLSVRFPDLGRTIDFTRRKNRDAVGFFPHTTSEPYLYRQPAAENDGWNTASLREAGLDPKPISALIDKILSADPVSNSLNIHGGNGGQLVIVIPDLDLVVGFNGGSYGNFPAWIRWSTALIPQYLIPAATSGQTH